MKIGEILSRLFFWGLGVIGGVGAYFNCPLAVMRLFGCLLWGDGLVWTVS